MARATNRGRRRGGLTEHEARFLRSDSWAKTIGKLGQQLVRWAGICFLGFLAYLVLTDWSGKTTIAEVTLAVKATGWQGAIASLGLVVGAAGLFLWTFPGSPATHNNSAPWIQDTRTGNRARSKSKLKRTNPIGRNAAGGLSDDTSFR